MKNPTIIAGIWTICFLVGASTHAVDIGYYGWLPYTFMPLPFNIYWTLLLPLDLLAATLLWIWRKAAIVLAILIMVSDVAVNCYAAFWVMDDWPIAPLVIQTAFLLFVLATAPRLWRTAL